MFLSQLSSYTHTRNDPLAKPTSKLFSKSNRSKKPTILKDDSLKETLVVED